MHVDIAIIGGGTIGVTLALNLAKYSNHSVALVDASSPPSEHCLPQGFDQRTIALSKRSLQLLNNIDVVAESLVGAKIQHIHVSDQTHAGQVRLHAQQHNIDAFGYVVSLASLGYAVYTRMANCQQQQLHYLPQTDVQNITRFADRSVIEFTNGESITATLLVLADGGRSKMAESLGFVRHQQHYQQTALCFVATTSSPHNGWAYERFTQQGPLALLPLSDNQFGVVWTVASSACDDLLALRKNAFICALQKAFGYRQGIITDVGTIEHFPLALKHLESVISQGAVAIGNAAQTLHPIAGQGANLGLRDAHVLSQLLASSNPANLRDYTLLNQYQQRRDIDRQSTIGLTDGLVHVFSNDHVPLVVGRNVGLSWLNLSSWGKSMFANQAMGMNHATF